MMTHASMAENSRTTAQKKEVAETEQRKALKRAPTLFDSFAKPMQFMALGNVVQMECKVCGGSCKGKCKDRPYNPRGEYPFSRRALEDMPGFEQASMGTMQIAMTGSRTEDARCNGFTAIPGYQIHHQDFRLEHGIPTCSMSYVRRDFHRSTPHMGACSQFTDAAIKEGDADFKYK